MAELDCLPSAVLFSFLLLTSSSQALQPQDDERCVKEMPPPEQPFRVVWNHPDPCERTGFPLNLSSYGIIHNHNRSFIGEEIQTLYQTGRWPMYSSGQAVNGGLPQVYIQCAAIVFALSFLALLLSSLCSSHYGVPYVKLRVPTVIKSTKLCRS